MVGSNIIEESPSNEGDFLIVCLGNIGKEYEKTRHNIGFMIGDAIISQYSFSEVGKKFKSELFKGQISDKTCYLIKPQTFMNLSGEAAQLVSAFYKIPVRNIIVILDDFEIDLEKIRLRIKGSAGTHNGMKSVIQLLRTDQVKRLKIGIGPLPEKWEAVNFVLSNFKNEELKKIKAIAEKASFIVKEIVESNNTIQPRTI